jgi:riboflavin kinase/FMN adenylyltransferase
MSKHAIIRLSDPSGLPPQLRGRVVAIGNFDGVHRGHQAVLAKAQEIARSKSAPAVALTFEPHPRTIFQPDEPVFRLTPAPVKARILDALGFDAVVEFPFTPGFAEKSAASFVSDMLVQGLGVSHVVAGFDFHFGKGREGGPAFLMDAAEQHGFGVTLVDAFRDENAETVSSSRIRDALADGDVPLAAGLLGYRYTVEAEVTGGKALGRTIGYPTANMRLSDNNRLLHGIYAVKLRRADGSIYNGVASFGRRPTVEVDGAPLLETYMFDFSGDLYGETCSVSFFGFLRGEATFEGLDPLIAQMRRDEEGARSMLARCAPLSALDARLVFGSDGQ